MTLASKLLEGYCPEGYDIVEEGLTPDIVMERANSICIECITALYEAAEDYFTGDLVAQTQVLTEGVGVVDKIKELIGKFVDRIKKIWEWFFEKVGKFPSWIKSMFSKLRERVDKMIVKFNGGYDVTAPDLSAVNDYIKEVGDVQDNVKTYSNDMSKMYNNVNLASLLKTAAQIISDASQSSDKDDVSITDKIDNEVSKMYKDDGRESRNEKLDECTAALIAAQDKLDSAKEVTVKSSKVLDCIKNIQKAISSVESNIIKPIETSSRTVEKILKDIKSDSFKSSLEHAFISGKDDDSSIGTKCASRYIQSSVKILGEVTTDMNKLMSAANSILKGYETASSRLVRAVQSKVEDGDNGGDN